MAKLKAQFTVGTYLKRYSPEGPALEVTLSIVILSEPCLRTCTYWAGLHVSLSVSLAAQHPPLNSFLFNNSSSCSALFAGPPE
jgi:hypothetical protein